MTVLALTLLAGCSQPRLVGDDAAIYRMSWTEWRNWDRPPTKDGWPFPEDIHVLYAGSVLDVPDPLINQDTPPVVRVQLVDDSAQVDDMVCDNTRVATIARVDGLHGLTETILVEVREHFTEAQLYCDGNAPLTIDGDAVTELRFDLVDRCPPACRFFPVSQPLGNDEECGCNPG
jgi:hypothetical protein